MRAKKKSITTDNNQQEDKSALPKPPERWDSKDVVQKTNLVRTQSGQIVPPRLRRAKSVQKVDITIAKNETETNGNLKVSEAETIPPTPPKRKKFLQKQLAGQVFMNLVEINGQCRMYVDIRDQEQQKTSNIQIGEENLETANKQRKQLEENYALNQFIEETNGLSDHFVNVENNQMKTDENQGIFMKKWRHCQVLGRMKIVFAISNTCPYKSLAGFYLGHIRQ